jgi:hypothetical protein
MAESAHKLGGALHAPQVLTSPHVSVTDNQKNIGKGLGTSKRGYSWYAGI